MRTLGSFNQQVNLPRHPEDRVPRKPEQIAAKTLSTGGYDLGLQRNTISYEHPLPSDSRHPTRPRTTPRPRMAGQALDADITHSSGLNQAFAAPMIGSAELRTPNIPQ